MSVLTSFFFRFVLGGIDQVLPFQVSIGCGSLTGTSSGSGDDTTCIATLVDTPAFLGKVELPVVVEVAVAPHCP
jgi:hypothetical protein